MVFSIPAGAKSKSFSCIWHSRRGCANDHGATPSTVMTQRIYLDWNATAPLRKEARAAMAAALDVCGNPSSVHAEGRAARRIVEAAREQVAALVGAQPRDVVFTSGGTEANMHALTPGLGAAKSYFERLLVSAIEHPSVLGGGRFPEDAVERLPVTERCELDLCALKRRLAEFAGRRILVSNMLANNETGVIQPICEIAHLVHKAGALLHVDAVQGPGRIPCDVSNLGADLLTISAHKIGGPKGVGALIRRDAALSFTEPLIRGGGQERGSRAGTENVPGIAGFGAAATAAAAEMAATAPRLDALRNRLDAGLRAASPQIVIFGCESRRLPNTTLFALPGVKAETAVIAFDLAGVAVSSGAACSSGKVLPSHVLAAMGVVPEVALGALRVSLGPTTTESDIEGFIDAWIVVSRALLKEAAGIAA
jgi:cysteine desulfurase